MGLLVDAVAESKDAAKRGVLDQVSRRLPEALGSDRWAVIEASIPVLDDETIPRLRGDNVPPAIRAAAEHELERRKSINELWTRARELYERLDYTALARANDEGYHVAP